MFVVYEIPLKYQILLYLPSEDGVFFILCYTFNPILACPIRFLSRGQKRGFYAEGRN